MAVVQKGLLPKEVLDLFPMWEYSCPICQTYVEPSISCCPKCKTSFNEEKWHVPPRFLRSAKAMSEYAHKILAPKLTERQRTLLFQYFTEVFGDGFESGNFSMWTGFEHINGATSIVGAPTHRGFYGMKASISGTASDSCASRFKTFSSAYSALFGRTYFWLNALPDTNNTYFILLCFRQAGIGNYIFLAGVYRDASGNFMWYIRHPTPTAVSYVYSAPEEITGRWYCLELKGIVHSVNGEVRLWIDGIEKITVIGQDTTRNGPMQSIHVGNRFIGAQISGKAVYFDDVVVADAPIGPVVGTYLLSVKSNIDVIFAVDGASHSTPWSGALEEGTHTVDMPSTIQIGTSIYNFKEWEDGSINPSRTINLLTDKEIVATYVLPTHFLSINSLPVGISFTVTRV